MEDAKVKVAGNPELAKENAKIYKKPSKEDKKSVFVNGKEKISVVKKYKTGKNKEGKEFRGVTKSSLIQVLKKGKKVR